MGGEESEVGGGERKSEERGEGRLGDSQGERE